MSDSQETKLPRVKISVIDLPQRCAECFAPITFATPRAGQVYLQLEGCEHINGRTVRVKDLVREIPALRG